MRKIKHVIIGSVILFLISISFIASKSYAACDCFEWSNWMDCGPGYYGGGGDSCEEIDPGECAGECTGNLGCDGGGLTIIFYDASETGVKPVNTSPDGCGHKIINVACSWGILTSSPFETTYGCRCKGTSTTIDCESVLEGADCP